MLAQENNLRLRDEGGSRGRRSTQDQKTRTAEATIWGHFPEKLRAIAQRTQPYHKPYGYAKYIVSCYAVAFLLRPPISTTPCTLLERKHVCKTKELSCTV